nr:CHAT domain-containing protein [Acaryochloris thomasi]
MKSLILTVGRLALMTAGVPSVIVSLWSVPDAPTVELMTVFDRQLQ